MNTVFPLRAVAATVIATAICTPTSLAARREGARLTIAENKVSIAGRPGGAGATIAPGETIVTGTRSRAEVKLPDGSVVRIGQGSSFSFDGSKLALNQGSALFNLTGKHLKIVTPTLVRTGGAGVVSVHASQGYNALFALKGNDTVNGSPLVAGQAWVRENGAPRTFTFDMQKMLGTSTLVTKFPQAPWVAQTSALASVQHQLTAATQHGTPKTVAARGATAAAGNPGKRPGFLGRLASVFSGNPATAGAATSVPRQAAAATLALNGNGPGGAGIVNGGTVNITNTGSNTLTRATSVANGTLLAFGGGDIARISSAGSGTFSGALPSNGTLVLNSGSTLAANTVTGATALVKAGAGTLVLNNTASLATSSGTLTLNSANTYTGNTTGNTGTLNLNTIPSGNLVINPGANLILNGAGGPVNLSTLQPGQTVNLNGTVYNVGAGTIPGGLVITPAP